MSSTPIMIFGVPRSGTSWLAETIAEANNIQYLVEPDNEGTNFLGYYYKRGLNRFPYFRPSETPNNYLKLFERALFEDYITYHNPHNYLLFKSNLISLNAVAERIKRQQPNRKFLLNWEFLLKKNIHPQKGKRRLVKSVHSILNIPFLMQHFNFIPLIIFRHPAAIIASHIKMNNPDADHTIFKNKKITEDYLQPYLKEIEKLSSPLSLMGFQVGLFHHVLLENIQQYNYKHIFYENLCETPLESFKHIFSLLNLNWEKRIESFISKNNQPGDGYDIQRVAQRQKEEWKNKWTLQELQDIRKGYHILPNQPYNLL